MKRPYMLLGRHRAEAAPPFALDIKWAFVVSAIWEMTLCDGELAFSLAARLPAHP